MELSIFKHIDLIRTTDGVKSQTFSLNLEWEWYEDSKDKTSHNIKAPNENQPRTWKERGNALNS